MHHTLCVCVCVGLVIIVLDLSIFIGQIWCLESLAPFSAYVWVSLLLQYWIFLCYMSSTWSISTLPVRDLNEIFFAFFLREIFLDRNFFEMKNMAFWRKMVTYLNSTWKSRSYLRYDWKWSSLCLIFEHLRVFEGGNLFTLWSLLATAIVVSFVEN